MAQKPRIPPAGHPVFLWPTPEREDELFYIERDGTLPKYKDWSYGDSYPDSETYPDHKLIHVTPQDGRNWSRWYYTSDRTNEDNYNWEHSQADLGGRKFDSVRRTYLTPRSSFSTVSPAAGAACPDVPVGLFTGYIFSSKQQRRTGDDLFDSLYVIEIREYINRFVSASVSHDDNTQGVLKRTETLYYRGEDYSGAPIETQILDETKWGVSAGGVMTEAEQLSRTWFLVTATDVVPQNKTTAGSKFGGLMLRTYEDYIDYPWPAVLGDDGSLDANGNPLGDLGFEIMDWDDKDGNPRNYVRPMFEKHGVRAPSRATIVEEWSLTAPDIGSDSDRPYYIRALPIVYNSPYLSINVPPSLHDSPFIQCDTSETDPTWGKNVLSKRTFPGTNVKDWPASLTATVEVSPLRGGYFIRHVTVYPPEEIPVP